MDDDGYDEWFARWAQERADSFGRQKPHIRRWLFENYDGCTWFFDLVGRACAEHDARLWYAETEDEVDEAHAIFRCRIQAYARTEDPLLRWFWWLLSYVMWTGVMIGGGRIWKYRQLAWARAR